MKKYVIFDFLKDGDSFIEILDVATDAEAIKKAQMTWKALGAYYRMQREAFDVALVEIDEDECPDYNRNPLWSAI